MKLERSRRPLKKQGSSVRGTRRPLMTLSRRRRKLERRRTSVRSCGLYRDDNATLDDLREAVTTLEDTERTGRRVFGGSHPLVLDIKHDLRNARAVLRAREALSPGSA